MERNRPTPEGRALGAILAKITDAAEPEIRAKFSNIAERCKSCAFRGGTFPNGCPETVIEAFECAMTGETFWCHQRFNPDGSPRDVCGGWMVALANVPEPLQELLRPLIADYKAAVAAAKTEAA